MICDKYEQLTPPERIRLIGTLVHCLQSDDSFFELAVKLIEKGNKQGLLEGVTILPETDFTNHLND